MVKAKREKINLQGWYSQHWTGWVKAMVPNSGGDYVRERKGDHIGYMHRKIEGAFSDNVLNECGIYEWKAKGTSDRHGDYVVYVGSTCRGRGSLGQRIKEYCRDGSHKRNFINRALSQGYELWVRVRVSTDKDVSGKMENQFLNNYDYAWNTRLNGQTRNIPP